MQNTRKRQEPRRPLVLQDEKREILKSIRDNLSKTTGQNNNTARTGESPDNFGIQARHDSISSGSTTKATTTQTKKPKNYKTKVLNEIRETLKPYKTDSGNSSLESSQDGSTTMDVNRTMLQVQQLVDMAPNEVRLICVIVGSDLLPNLSIQLSKSLYSVSHYTSLSVRFECNTRTH